MNTVQLGKFVNKVRENYYTLLKITQSLQQTFLLILNHYLKR